MVMSKIDRLFCQQCGVEYLVENGIPDFILEDLSKSTHPILRSVSRVDKLAKIYETWLWYPIVYHFYGGLFIPSVKDEVKMITEMGEYILMGETSEEFPTIPQVIYHS